MVKRILVVDDEKPARSKVIRFLKKCDPQCEVIEAANGAEAVDQLDGDDFDAAFLDIQMPGMNGFEVLQAVGIEKIPKLVFATAFDEYAIQAFDANANDYLLKPFSFERFEQAYKKLTAGEQVEESQESLMSLLQDLRESSEVKQRLAIRDAGKISMVDPSTVMYVKSDEHYAFLHTSHHTYCERKSLKQFEKILDATLFRRIHRSTIVNLDFIQEFEPLSHGDYSVLMKDGSRHTVSRRYTGTLGINLT